ncbi:pentatricopeptide repeat-containing protein At3g47530-like [Phalaenopsis equestris]|uniref:pentatricopeptide repeat-containing protein At3g47530-like n=1 Tax=Phalaenopsis equestris TaxID=78828 RepID=UPI0009E30F66|nr:pentatricopeptide repeat-containing protein At3g47530-like [Phalaenopsis equestris]
MASSLVHLPNHTLIRNTISLIKTHSSNKSNLIQFHAQLLRSYLILDTFVCNTILKAYMQTISPSKTLTFYKHMRSLGVPGNSFSSSFALNSCIKISSLCIGQQLHGRIVQDGHQSDSVLFTSLMSLYSLCRELDSVRTVFDDMPNKDTVTWNVLISSFACNNRTKDALLLFDAMQSPEYGLKPDAITCLLLLQACAHLGALNFGERMHKYVEEHGFGNLLNIRNSLIVMYSKSGAMEKAYRVFRDMSERNVVTWSSIISGLAMNGYGREAISAFKEMHREGVAPDEQTFTGVLSACSHCGLVDEGISFLFDAMRFDYKLTPNVCHYGCMVDLFGRAGLLDHAYNFIVSEMVVQPDVTIWRTLLGACRIHRYVELSERVMEHLIESKAQQAGDYVLLLNIYASVGHWNKVAEVRGLMKEKGIQTSRGCTTMELNGRIHEFVADDDSHPRKAEIYGMLDEIGKQLKMAGYVANMSSELHDLDEEEKTDVLFYHSEKIALAFGILATAPGRTLRIAKNLRICVDCHDFTKVFSSVYGRMVIVRDRNRFHHFRDGSCSCNEYW